ncbi:MAG: hypothetical protein CMR00_09575, partial [[Chlorobium] sp. 445]
MENPEQGTRADVSCFFNLIEKGVIMNISKWPKWYIWLWSLLLYSCREIDEQGALVPPTADQDRQLPQISITVAGKTRAVHLETFGNPNNPPLFVLHGSYT